MIEPQLKNRMERNPLEDVEEEVKTVEHFHLEDLYKKFRYLSEYTKGDFDFDFNHRVTVFAANLRKKFTPKKCDNCILYHVLVSSSLDKNLTKTEGPQPGEEEIKIDFKGKYSIAKFIDDEFRGLTKQIIKKLTLRRLELCQLSPKSFLNDSKKIADTIREKFENYQNYRLFHFLTGSTYGDNFKEFDFPDEYSIIGFMDFEYKKLLREREEGLFE